MTASSPAALLSFHGFAQGPWCPWCMGSQWWQHLLILSLVLGMNPEELSSHPFPTITSISLSSLFHGDSELISPPGWFFADVPAVAFRLPVDDVPLRACAGLMRADSWGGGLQSCCPVCRGHWLPGGLQKESKPSGVYCCVLSLLEGLPAWSLCPALSALAPSGLPPPLPCVPAEGMQRLCQSCTLNETNLFCTWPPTSSACLDVKVKLHYYRRIDFT